MKLLFLLFSKWIGLFHLARLTTGKGLRILCYHGFSSNDERFWRPRYFISPETFNRRLGFLRDNNFPVISIDSALRGLRDDSLPPCSTVITIDDGSYTFSRLAASQLQDYRYESTLYVTSYYVHKGTPIFRLVVDFMFWKTKKDKIDLSSVDLPFGTEYRNCSLDAKNREELVDKIIEFGEKKCSEGRRGQIAEQLGRCLDVPYRTICESRVLSLMSIDELRDISNTGVSLALHTHRHTLPIDEAAAVNEIEDNRRSLASVGGNVMRHFCYPSGEWDRRQWDVLNANGIESAVTCDPGLNYAHTPRYALKRILDSSEVSQLEFEAEIVGYSELIRKLRSCLRI